MSVWREFTIEITSAAIADFISESSEMGINFRNVQFCDELHVRAQIFRTDYITVSELAINRGATVKIVGMSGFYYYCAGWLKRPVLLLGMVLWIFLVLYLPTRVLFVKIEGNKSVDTVKILDAVEKSGICFGATRSDIRSEKVKNALLSHIDSLQWVGVNTYGCVAVISVKERRTSLNQNGTNQYRNIIATRDGVISSITATKGKILCSVGQAVRAGQVIVSGYTDCGLLIKAESPVAEVFALTNRRLSAIALASGIKRSSVSKIRKRYSIQIGKNIVKLYNSSGILDMSCVKIYTQEYMKLPGDFLLPISIITETIYYYDLEVFRFQESDEFTWLQESTDAYLRNDMLAGRILNKHIYGELSDGVYSLEGFYICNELIGRVSTERAESNDG